MKPLLSALAAFLGLGANQSATSTTETALDYDQMVILDAEDLAETGIKEAYERLKPKLKTYLSKPAEVIEKIDNDFPSYSVSCLGVTYDIYSPSLASSEGQAWGRATYALFTIVNAQLKDSAVKFYALNGGNDLGGIFLTVQQVISARKILKKKTDWPYLPTLEHPWYGQQHEQT